MKVQAPEKRSLGEIIDDKFANTYERFANPKQEDVRDFYDIASEIMGEEDYDASAADPRKGYGAKYSRQDLIKIALTGSINSALFRQSVDAHGSYGYDSIVVSLPIRLMQCVDYAGVSFDLQIPMVDLPLHGLKRSRFGHVVGTPVEVDS